MNDYVKHFFGNLGLIFRHFISGAVFITSFYISQEKINVAFKDFNENKAVFTVIAIIAGSLLYSIHRGFTNPIFDRVRHRYLSNEKTWERNFFQKSRDLMLERWMYTAATKSIPSRITDWGDYIALLYTSSLAIVVGLLTAFLFAPIEYSFNCWLVSVIILAAFLLCLAGFATDCRKHIIEQNLYY